MATMTMEPAIKIAMDKMGLKERTDELLDILYELHIDRELELSWEECLRGECSDLEEAVTRIRQELHNER